MPIDIEQKSQELKDFVSQYDTKIFMGDLSTLLLMVAMQNPPESLVGLVAPQRQIFYLAGLHLTSNKNQNNKTKFQYTPEEWNHIKSLLIEIEAGYSESYYPSEGIVLDDVLIEQRLVGLVHHLNFFNQGDLNYEEQIIERIITYFSPFDVEIKAHFGLNIVEFITIYRFLDEMLHQKLNSVFPLAGEPTMDDISIEQFAEGIMNPEKRHLAVPPSYIRMSENMADPGKKYRFSLDQLDKEFDPAVVRAFVSTLSIKRTEGQFLYYTENNPYFNQPLFEVNEGEFQSIEIKQIVIAIYNQIQNFAISNAALTEPFYTRRGVELENKIVGLFQSILGEDAKIYQSYYTNFGSEQDILILYKGMALIIEAKASKIQEPRSDPNKAYELVKRNFDKVIQKGYDQSYRVKQKFLNKEVLSLYDDLALSNEIAKIRTKNYHSVFSLVVTLERFGQIQTDLDDLLEVQDDDQFPLSICIDDLEVFLLAFKKRGSKFSELLRYFDLREYLHGALVCGDELEICGAILSKQISDKDLQSNKIIKTHPDHAQIFDDYYNVGLGFKDEINLERKTSGKFMTMFR
ncbi:hypothetical protein [Maribacter sp. ACAM166]|uniref:hypothetical protein n=1 Tax=Maribacter sp. ACAM166 TaxID=2508996 RepID=UPI0010FD1A89|nr:hypothetical protein [Maribacter sp. ACAM166]TLP79233.1 hypothetical protein ES765_10730 [Maribacter sp. ACAM166]